MMHINSLKQAEDALSAYIPQVAAYAGDNMTLERMWPLLQAVGNPHERLRAVHIAGTSGKTSTAYYISSLLVAAGKRVGLTVSPHVDSLTERLQIDGSPISDERFCEYLEEFLPLVEESGLNPSYFELLIVFVFWVADKLDLDYLVVETGMGGLLDATNVLQNKNKLCVITDIGLDHTHILGNTLSAIAGQKAGIIHEHNRVFMYRQSPEVVESVRKRVEEKQARLDILEEAELRANTTLSLSGLAPFQARNWLLAEEVCRFMADRDGFNFIHVNTVDTTVPGRIEQRRLADGSLLVMDGAHNQQKMHAFVSGFQSLFPGNKALIMLALKEGKDYESVLAEIKPIAGHVILTTFNTSQDLPAVSNDPRELLRVCHELEISAEVIDDNGKALQSLHESNEPIKVMTGSFYLLSQARAYLNH